MTMTGKTAIITGAGRGIGLAIARTFARQGANIAIAEIDASLEQSAHAALKGHSDPLFIQADIACPESVREITQKTLEKFGRIDFLINNAAIGHTQPIEQYTIEQWNRQVAVNLTGPFLAAKFAAPALTDAKGAIVNIASTRAIMSEPNTFAYSASKAGLIGLTHSLAVSLGPDIRVNCISPGWIDTQDCDDPDAAPLTPEDHAQHPAGRVGTPDDIAAMALYLCSEQAAFITGQNVVIDGGMTRKMIYVE